MPGTSSRTGVLKSSFYEMNQNKFRSVVSNWQLVKNKNKSIRLVFIAIIDRNPAGCLGFHKKYFELIEITSDLF